MLHNRLFSHNIDIFNQARKKFRPQSADDETVLAKQLDYVWDPEWSSELFMKIPTDTYPLTVDPTHLNYNSFLPERTGNNSK